jgi:hypothetical protein
MTSSLNLPSGSTLPNGYSEQRASFQRRKNYDPIKAVESEKQKRLLKLQQASSHFQNQGNMHSSSSKNSIVSENECFRSNRLDCDDSMSDSSQSFSIPLQSLKANVSNKQVYRVFLLLLDKYS